MLLEQLHMEAAAPRLWLRMPCDDDDDDDDGDGDAYQAGMQLDTVLKTWDTTAISTYPEAHLLTMQVALKQETSITLDREVGAGQDAPQAPQLALSVRRLIQALPPQCTQQTPLEQV
jgi:hypothetical protein